MLWNDRFLSIFMLISFILFINQRQSLVQELFLEICSWLKKGRSESCKGSFSFLTINLAGWVQVTNNWLFDRIACGSFLHKKRDVIYFIFVSQLPSHRMQFKELTVRQTLSPANTPMVFLLGTFGKYN